ncbi:Transmembrane protein [Seminavis robusta]|uniref:Transmembrane protein n=1 Tax=Seminavis robusta TaxID=568900 RepID=A0A9N8ERS2_9STRA|nr:Transmembrane protein [Seminavis robusta]|eukprot:Sro1425_g271520.1 Transmembrane protein (442) ;mRNA; f:6981-8425
MLDIAVMHLPGSCANTRSGCDWTDFGIGSKSADGDVRWCCSQDAVELGLCDGGDKYGRLIVNNTQFTGSHRFVEIPPTGQISDEIRYGKIEEPNDSGRYVVIFANCNDEGREVLVTGATVWKSKHGYLPGELYEFMYFYIIVTLIYFGLMAAFALSMNAYAASRIPLEKWILGTIIMGLLETFFRTGSFFVWNEDGTNLMIAVYIGVFMGVLKCGISRCLIVMVSLGWGVVRDTLGPTLPKIVALGIFYVGTSSVTEFMTVIAVEDVQTLSLEEEDELFDVVEILSFVVFVVDVIFVLWILDALNSTMEYLESMNQTRKLMRYLRFRCIFLFAILFSVVWVVFDLVDSYDEDGILEEQHEWIVLAAKELNYLFLLIGIAVLWWPNPTAREYAYVMELPSLAEGDGENELELTGVVPSALDEYDDHGMNGNGLHSDFDKEFK